MFIANGMNAASAIRLLIILSLSYGLAVFPMIPGSVRLQGAVNPVRLLPPPFVPPRWVPSGSMVDKLQIQVYTDEIAEYNAMLQTPSQVDLGDWPMPKSLESTFLTDTRFILSSPTAGFDMFDIEFNHANTFFGISDNHGSNPAGIEFRQAIAHLIDKQAFINNVLGGLGSPIDNAVPPAQSLLHPGVPCDTNSPSTGCTGSYTANYTTNGVKGSYSLSGPCGWDTLFPTGCISAFHYAADTVDAFGIVTASASNLDFCDAAHHLVAAGLANGVNAADCSVAGHQLAGLSGGSITFVVRSDNPPRQKLGTALAARMCELFNGAGTTSCTQVSICNLVIPQQLCFGEIGFTGFVQLGWHMYTGGLRLASEFDQLYSFYNSQFASSACGGRLASFGNNYVYYCRADYDHFSRMLEFNDTLSGAIASAQVAMQIFGRTVASIPIWSSIIEIPYSTGWTGVANAIGVGPVSYFTSLNAWSPSPSLFGTLRWGFALGTVSLNPFGTITLSESRVDDRVYDTLVRAAPYNATTPFAWLADQFYAVSASTNPQCASIRGTVSCVIFNLRPNVHFHDGVSLTGSDVKFSFLAFKQIPGLNSAKVANIVDVSYVPGPAPGTQSVFVHLSSQSPFAIFNLGQVPILPQHIWASDATSPCPGTPTGGTPPASCTVNSTLVTADPVVNHLLIGTGPFECVDLSTSQVGGGCTRTASGGVGTQAVDAGGTIILQRFGFGFPGYDQMHSYFRDSWEYKEWLWADRENQGAFNIVDVSNAGACWNKPVASNPGCAHWDSPAATITCVASAGTCDPVYFIGVECPCGLPGGNNNGILDVTEVSKLGALWQVSWNSPAAYTTFANAQPTPQTLYEGGVEYSGSAPP